MPPQNPDELSIGLGLEGFEELEAKLERVQVLLERAAETADKAFKNPSSSTKEFANELAKMDRAITNLATKYASFGKAGAAGFEQISKQQLIALEKLTQLQSKIRDLDKERASSPGAARTAELVKELQNLSAQYTKLERQANSLQTVDVAAKLRGRLEAGVPKPQKDVEYERAMRDIERMQKERLNMERSVSRMAENNAEKEAKSKTRIFQNYVKDVLAGLKRIATEENTAGRGTRGSGGKFYKGRGRVGGLPEEALSELGLSGLSGALGPVAFFAALGFGIKKVVDISQQAIERASEQARANRTLASSAIEAGISIDKLTVKNREFASLTALSDVKATSTVAKITQLATLTQRPESIDKLIRGFANLGAARGLDATGIETVVQQIITGQDEGYKKLLLPNPSQLQQKFARENNRTVGSLTAVEKAQIFQDAFLKKAELFNGAAEARLRSVDGRAAKLNATIENLANTLSSKFTNSYDVSNFLDALTHSLAGFNSEAQNLVSLLESGKNIDDLLGKQAKQNPAWAALTGLGNILGGAAGALFSGVDAVVSPRQYWSKGGASADLFGAAVKQFGGTDQLNREDFLRQQINASVLERTLNRRTENETRIALAEQKAEEARRALADKEEKRLTEVFKNPRSNAAQIVGGLQAIKNYQNPAEVKIDEAALNAAVKSRYETRDTAGDFGKTTQQVFDAIKDQVTKEFQAAVDVQNKALFSDEDKAKLVKEGEAVLEQLAKKAREIIDSARSELVDALSNQTDNPFVKLLDDASTAAETARRKFSSLGPELATMMGKVAEAQARTRIAVAEFESQFSALKLRQEARRERSRPLTQTNAFERRLGEVTENAGFLGRDIDLGRQIQEEGFLGSTGVTGKPRKIREALLRSIYGAGYDTLTQGARGSREEKDAYREMGVRIKRGLEEAKAFSNIDTKGLGVYGEGAIAQMQLDRLPGAEELLASLRVGGPRRQEAQKLLRLRRDLSQTTKDANEQKFQDFIANQRFLDLRRTDATELAKNLFDKGGALTEKAKLDKFLTITDELGTGELTPELREQRIKALGAKAEIEEKAKATAEEQMKKITEFVDTLQKQTSEKGLKVDLAEQAIVNLQVNAAGVEAQLESRPSEQRGR